MRIFGFAYELETKWEAYKYSGKEENNYGDIALLIKIRYRDGKELEGVGLLEAKKRSLRSTKFDAIKVMQLRRIVKNAPRALIALYDYDRITGFPTNINPYSKYVDLRQYGQRIYELLPMTVPYTNCVVVPGNLAIASNAFDTSLYYNSVPLSHQLCNRYFLGFDIEYKPEAILAAKGFSAKGRIPKYVMTINIGQGIIPPESRDSLNSNFFTQVFE